MTILSPAPDHEVITMVLILLCPPIGTSVVLHTVTYGVLVLLLVPRWYLLTRNVGAHADTDTAETPSRYRYGYPINIYIYTDS